MAKKLKVEKVIKLQIAAGKATPAQPIGPALGGAGLNIMAFCKEFNAKTKDKGNDILPVEISVYPDKSFTFITREPPVAELLKNELGIEKGSGVPNRDKVGKITRAQAKKIAERKFPDLNAANLDTATNTILGTARSMGIELVEENSVEENAG